MKRIESIWLGHNGSHILIEFGYELDMHKQALYGQERWIKTMKDKVLAVHNAMKGSGSYVRTTSGFEEIDWYDSCDSYEIPFVLMERGSGKRIPAVRMYTSNDIPKNWKVNLTVVFKPGINMLQVRRAAKAYGWNLTKEQDKGLQKALKEESGYSWDNYDDQDY